MLATSSNFPLVFEPIDTLWQTSAVFKVDVSYFSPIYPLISIILMIIGQPENVNSKTNEIGENVSHLNGKGLQTAAVCQ